jgi:replicative DNA helicase
MIRFATASEQLADDVIDLVRSLGGWATKNRKQTSYAYEGQRREGRLSFVVNIAHPEPRSLFTLPEKRDRAGVARKRHKQPTFVSIEPVRRVEAQCIAVTHPTQLYITDDYVVTHNTALALNMALYASKIGHTIGIFSLEMSSEQLVSRLLCSEARVDAHRLRTGYLNREEWARLADALRRLCETQVYLDDTAGASVLEMRAKCRRLKAEHNLDLIIIDYLQLMSGRGRNESRQQEVSQISRDLKGLAKELNVPVIALSQLSRATETRSDHRPQLSDLRESGCLAGESLVTMADTGAQVPIRDLVGKSGFAVWALNEGTFKIERANVSRAFATGTKPVYRLTTRLGRTIRATANHKFRTFAGWKRLDELSVGERLAAPREVPSPYSQTMRDAERVIVSREYVARAAAVGHSDSLSRVIESEGDVYWDSIASIEPDGEAEVYDLTVDRFHNFIVNCNIAHNSIEQDADVVCFIYRDEVYNPSDENRGVAELIIGKQRNGPIGTVQMAFLKEFTRFENMWKE